MNAKDLRNKLNGMTEAELETADLSSLMEDEEDTPLEHYGKKLTAQKNKEREEDAKKIPI
jgi:hypothetical protein